jgi:hypothetical protein
MAFFLPPGCSFWLPDVLGAGVDGARDDSWRGRFTVCLYLMAKHSHVGVDVDGQAYPLHWPTVYSCQMRGHGLLPGVILSCCYSGQWCLSGDVKLPRRRYFMESLPLW